MVLLCCLSTMVLLVVIASFEIETCSQPTSANNFTYHPQKKGNYSVGDTIIYGCEQDLTLLGEERSTCQADTTWSEAPPLCGILVKIERAEIKLCNNNTTDINDVTVDGNNASCISSNLKWCYNDLTFSEMKAIRWIKIIHHSGKLNVKAHVRLNNYEKPCSIIPNKENYTLFECDAKYNLTRKISIQKQSSNEAVLCEVEIFTTADFIPDETNKKSETTENSNIAIVIGTVVVAILLLVSVVIIALKFRHRQVMQLPPKENACYEMTTYPDENDYVYATYSDSLESPPPPNDSVLADMTNNELYHKCQRNLNNGRTDEGNSLHSRTGEANHLNSRTESLSYAYVSFHEPNDSKG